MTAGGAFSGKVAIVTGAAQGLGEAVAEKLVIGGAKVIVSDRNLRAAERVAQRLGALGESVSQEVDMTIPKSVATLADVAMSRWGRIDILANNASNAAKLGERDSDVVATSLEVWDEPTPATCGGPRVRRAGREACP